MYLMMWRCWSRRSFHVAWTPATHFSISDGLTTRLTVCLECCCTFRVGRSTVWPHHAGAAPAALTSGSEAGGLQDSHLGLPFVLRHCMALSYMAADCQLSSEEGRRQRRSACSNFGTDVSRLPVQGCGTAFQLVVGKRTSVMNKV